MEADIEHAASLEASLETAEVHDKRAYEHVKLDMCSNIINTHMHVYKHARACGYSMSANTHISHQAY